MPLYNKTANHYFSFNLGRIHFLAVNYDWYYNNANNPQIQKDMMDWLHNDLTQATKTRDQRPWIIVLTHRPIYCSYNSLSDLPWKRCYNFPTNFSIFDDLWYEYRVDWVMQAHVHYWER